MGVGGCSCEDCSLGRTVIWIQFNVGSLKCCVLALLTHVPHAVLKATDCDAHTHTHTCNSTDVICNTGTLSGIDALSSCRIADLILFSSFYQRTTQFFIVSILCSNYKTQLFTAMCKTLKKTKGSFDHLPLLFSNDVPVALRSACLVFF